MKIIIHRGTHEIGGSCVEIQSKKSRILIDIGMPLVEKLKPKKIIPIHTFHPDQYAGLFSQKIEQISDGEVFEV